MTTTNPELLCYECRAEPGTINAELLLGNAALARVRICPPCLARIDAAGRVRWERDQRRPE